MAENSTKTNTTKGKGNLPRNIQNLINYAPVNLETVNLSIAKINLKNFDDGLLLREITHLIDGVNKIRDERTNNSRNNKNIFNINTEVHTVVLDDPNSKKIYRLLINLKNLLNLESKNLNDSFLKNNYQDILQTIEGNKNLIADLNVILDNLNNSINNNGYKEHTLFESIAKNLTIEELEEIIKEKQNKVA